MSKKYSLELSYEVVSTDIETHNRQFETFLNIAKYIENTGMNGIEDFSIYKRIRESEDD
jgi:hypothetical protein